MSWLSPGRWLLYGALLITVWLGVMGLDQARQAIGYNKAQAEHTTLALQASEAARAKEADWQAQLQKANQDAKIRTNKLQADAAVATAASNSLRNDLSTLRANLPTLTRQAVEHYADTASELLTDCGRRYQDMASQADKHAADQQTLEASWPK